MTKKTTKTSRSAKTRSTKQSPVLGKPRPRVKASPAVPSVTGAELFERVATILDEARARVVRVVNTEMVLAYWQIGREIVEHLQRGAVRAGHGDALIEELSARLGARFGRGFSTTNLRYFRTFFLAYQNREPTIREPLGGVASVVEPGAERAKTPHRRWRFAEASATRPSGPAGGLFVGARVDALPGVDEGRARGGATLLRARGRADGLVGGAPRAADPHPAVRSPAQEPRQGRRAGPRHGTPIRVPVPQERLGLAYTPGSPFPIDGADGLLGVRVTSEDITYGGGQSLEDANLDFERDDVVRYGTIVREDDALVTVRNPCLEVTARVPTRLLLPLPDPTATPSQRKNSLRHPEIVRNGLIRPAGFEGIRLVTRDQPMKDHLVKAGTAVLWPDGRPAGQVSADHVLEQHRRDEGDLACFAVPLIHDEPTTLTLCFAAADVVPFVWSRPRVRQGKATITGSHVEEIIRRIVRAHLNEVHYCYKQGLTRDPALAGTVSVRFDIAPTGEVTRASVSESSLPDEAVAACIAKAVARWTFPKSPGADVTVVTYPFMLEPG
jgi:TonB family protein